MNDYYRTILNDSIKMGLANAVSASAIKHPFLTGRLREIVVHDLLEPMLNHHFSMGSGKVMTMPVRYQMKSTFAFTVKIYTHQSFFLQMITLLYFQSNQF